MYYEKSNTIFIIIQLTFIISNTYSNTQSTLRYQYLTLIVSKDFGISVFESHYFKDFGISVFDSHCFKRLWDISI